MTPEPQTQAPPSPWDAIQLLVGQWEGESDRLVLGRFAHELIDGDGLGTPVEG